MADKEYTGRDVWVFGAAGALGAGVAAAFATAGASVTGVDRAVPQVDRQLPGIDYQAADVLDDEAVAALFRAHRAPWAVINTIGGYAPPRSLPDLDAAQLRGQLELNLVSAALITKYALRALQDAGQGRVVHTASRAGVEHAGSGFAYSVSKLGVLRLVAMAAAEVRGSGVTVNCVVPTIIDTPANRAALPSANFAAWPKPSDIARAYLYLASPDTELINGATIPV